MTMSETMTLKIEREDFEAEVVSRDGAYTLRWSDYVTNEWSQPFDTLVSAVFGLGALVQAVEDGSGADFDHVVPKLREIFEVSN